MPAETAQVQKVHSVATLLRLLRALLPAPGKEEAKLDSPVGTWQRRSSLNRSGPKDPDPYALSERAFVFALAWGLGGLLGTAHRRRFDGYASKTLW